MFLFVDKMSLLKKVKQRRPLYSCSRIRVGEDSPKEEGTNNFRSIHPKTLKYRSDLYDTETFDTMEDKVFDAQPTVGDF